MFWYLKRKQYFHDFLKHKFSWFYWCKNFLNFLNFTPKNMFHRFLYFTSTEYIPPIFIFWMWENIFFWFFRFWFERIYFPDFLDINSSVFLDFSSMVRSWKLQKQLKPWISREESVLTFIQRKSAIFNILPAEEFQLADRVNSYWVNWALNVNILLK